MIDHERNIKSIGLEGDSLKNIKKQILIGPKDDFSGYMRMFTIGENGHTPYHTHDWYHVNYVTEGKGILILGETENELEKGSIAYVSPGIKHQFRNTGKGDLKLLCLVPEKGDSY
jgi:quercetin dioxygenase-like cupin family protein